MSIIGRLLGTEKALTQTISLVGKGLDSLVHTDEEKAQEAAADRSEARKMFITWIDKSQGQNLARRILAFAIVGTWLGQYLFQMTLNLTAVWLDDPKQVTEAGKIIGDYADQMSGAVMLIIGFYFAAPHIDKIIGPAMERFAKR